MDLLLPAHLDNSLKRALINNELSGKHKQLIDFSENLLIYVCSYIIGEYRKVDLEVLEYEKLFYQNNKNLSTGTYQMFLREGLKTLKKSNIELALSELINGKNEFPEISRFILAFETLKSQIHEGIESDFNKKIEQTIASRNNNFGKTNLLSFFDTFIQLRNRVAHPHKEVKGKLIHWPSNPDYYSVVNSFLEKAVIEACEKLEELWSYNIAEIKGDDNDESILEFTEIEEPLEIEDEIQLPIGTQLLVKKNNDWIVLSLKETLKVGANILEIIEKEKQEAKRLESIEEFKLHVETALEDKQISSDELRFLESVGENRLGLSNEKVLEVIMEVAKKLEIEDPFPEIDKRFTDAIDESLLNGELNPFLLRLLGQNYGVHEKKFDEILAERAEVLNIDLNQLSENTNLTLTKDAYSKMVGFIQSMSWIQSLGALNRSGLKKIYEVKSGNHLIAGTKEFLHRTSFIKAEKYVRSIIGELEDKMGVTNNWIVESNNWQQGFMSSYVWIKAYPDNKRLSSELGLGLSLHQDDVAIGFLADWNKVTNLEKVNFGLLLNLFNRKMNKYLNEYRTEFMKYDDLKINGYGGGDILTPLSIVLSKNPNYFEHFFQFNQIRFFRYYKDLDVDPTPIYTDLEISYSLFGNLVNEVIYDYDYMIEGYVNPIESYKQEISIYMSNLNSIISEFTDTDLYKYDDPRRGSIYTRISEKIKGKGCHLKVGFWERINGDIYFGIKLQTTHSQEEIVYQSLRNIVNKLELDESSADVCKYDGFYSIHIPVVNNNKLDIEIIDKSILLFREAIENLTLNSAKNQYAIFGLRPQSEILNKNKIYFDEILEYITSLELSSNKVSKGRNLIHNLKYLDWFGSSKKYGWHSIQYGFDLEHEPTTIFVKINIHDSLKAANLVLALKSEFERSNEFEQLNENSEGSESGNWLINECADSQFISSSDWNRNHSAKLARVDSKPKYANWSAKKNDTSQWIGIDLNSPTRIEKIRTQGRFNRDQWVTKYYLSWSMDGKKWTTDNQTIYDGNNDRNAYSDATLELPITCRFIRIHPLEWFGHISMRFDIMGTSADKEKIEFIKRIALDGPISEQIENAQTSIIKTIENIRNINSNAFGFKL